MATWIWVLIVIAAVVVVAMLVSMATMRRRTAALRERFGPEYDRAVQARDDQRAAEAELRGREKQRAQLDIRPLPETERARFAQEWRGVQERFVDEPSNAVVAADDLVRRVMSARGYPIDNFEAQADLVSVDHPGVVENYRYAHGVYELTRTQQASTENLREAMLRYRSLFSELLRANGAQAPAKTTAQPEAGAAGGGPAPKTAAADSGSLGGERR